jgi:hypothetical protein
MLAAGALGVGWLFYLVVRGVDPLRLLPASRPLTSSSSDWLAALLGSLPSVLHALAALCLFRAVCRQRRAFWTLWGASTVGFELLQAPVPILGRFDPYDLAALLPVLAIGGLMTRQHQWHGGAGGRRAQLAAVLAAGGASLATSQARSWKQTHVPVCMPLAVLRASFAVEAPRALTAAGKITRNDRLLLVSEPLQGVHVFDNADPAAPVPLAFLKIPGNSDVALTDQYLYADSAIDLLTIKFDDTMATLVSRQEGILAPLTPRDISGASDFHVSEEQVEACYEKGGVVVGYDKREDGEHFEQKIEENKRD